MSRLGRGIRDNGLSLAFLLIFLAALAGQAVAGQHLYNQEQRAHGGAPVSLAHFVTTSRFAAETAENWQSEFLQFTLYIVATVYLVQRGSSESKPPGEEGPESDTSAPGGGLRAALYGHSLAIAFGAIFVLAWAAQALAGWRDFDRDQMDHHEAPVGFARYLSEPDFWDRTLQNWQSEFLAVGSMAIFAVYLRQRGSPESKPVGAADEETDG